MSQSVSGSRMTTGRTDSAAKTIHLNMEKRRKIITVQSGFLAGTEIDEGDYHVVNEFYQEFVSGEDYMNKDFDEEHMIKILQDDPNRRVHEFRMPELGLSLPSTFLRLNALEKLVVNSGGAFVMIDSDINEIPKFLGEWKSLKELTILIAGREFPDETTPDLSGIEVLHINSNSRVSISSAFGDLSSLKSLNMKLSGGATLSKEIGDLTNLEELVCHGEIKSIPGSIGDLKKLKFLSLPMISSLTCLPDEIGDLTSLETLDLFGTMVEGLPSSIGNLTNLKQLILPQTKNLRSLPEAIGKLRNLEVLDLKFSALASTTNRSFVESLAIFTKHLKNLRVLLLPHTILDNDDFHQLQIQLVKELPQLGCLGHSYDCRPKCKIIAYSLICNRANSRLGVRLTNNESHETLFDSCALWPMMLSKPKRAFDKYPECGRYWGYWGSYECGFYTQDAMFQLVQQFGPKLAEAYKASSQKPTSVDPCSELSRNGNAIEDILVSGTDKIWVQ